jgi:CheY-like chemotaxis protein
MLQEQLNTWGFRHDDALNGEMAIQKMSNAVKLGSPFDIVLIDAKMPEMSGYILEQKIIQNPDFQNYANRVYRAKKTPDGLILESVV